MRFSVLSSVAAIAGAIIGQTSVRAATPLGTVFSYQGQIQLNDAPVSDTCDFQFTLWDDPAAGSQIGPTLLFDGQGLNPAPVQVESGLFNVELDFGVGAFDGDARWLEIATACPSGGTPVTLTPRQPLNPAPYALWAQNAWDVLGNAGTSPTSNFVGTTDRSELVLATNALERMRLMLNGQVGVGTSSPSARIHLLAGPAESSLAAQRSGQPNPDLLVNGSGQVVVGAAGGVLAKLAVNAAAGEDAMRVRVNGVTNFFIGQDGQVGVGTSVPSAKLQINPDIGEDALAVEAVSGTGTDLAVDAGGHVIVGSTGGTLAKLTVDSGAGEEAMRVRTEGVTRLFVGSDGQVGVGTSVPAARLQVNASTGEEALAVDASGGAGTDLTVDSGGRVIVGSTGGVLAKLTVDSAAGEDAFRVRVAGTTRFIVEDGGNVGVGTSVPAAKFQVDPAANQQGMVVRRPGLAAPALTVDDAGDVIVGAVTPTIARFTVNSDAGENPFSARVQGTTEVVITSSGNLGVGNINPTAPIHVDGGSDASLGGGGFVIVGGTTGQNIVMDDNEIVSRNNGVASVLHLNAAGGPVAIGGQGITIPNDAALAVDGKILCEEVEVKLSGDWPDYVFEEDYPLTPLPELEATIKAQKHLPDVPSAAAVQAEGIAVGDMQARMLRKIEELTLYVIEIDKANRTLSSENEQLRKRLAHLEEVVAK